MMKKRQCRDCGWFERGEQTARGIGECGAPVPAWACVGMDADAKCGIQNWVLRGSSSLAGECMMFKRKHRKEATCHPDA